MVARPARIIPLRVEALLDLIEQPHHRPLVACIRDQLRRHNQLMLAVHRHLRVVALLEPFGAGLHDGTVRVGEVALCALSSGSP